MSLLLVLIMGLAAAGLVASLVVEAASPASRGLVKRARALGAPSQRGKSDLGPVLRAAASGKAEAWLERLLPRPAALRVRLEATGRPITLAHYAAASAGLALLAAVVAGLLGMPVMLAVLEGVATGLWIPHAAVGFLMARRRAAFLRLFPEAIGLIVRGLRSGLPVTETIAVVGREIGDPVGEIFRGVAEQVRLGASLEDALWHAAHRLKLQEFNFLIISLSVQRETGGNLAETLQNLETILRRRQQMRLKIKAMSSEATASALIIGSLPFIMALLMTFVSPDYIRVLFTNPMGLLMLGVGSASLAIGGLVMRQMVRFDI